MKKIITLFVLLLPMAVLWAQNEIPNPKETITEVKQDEERFIYADQTYTTVDQALQHANDLLMKELREYFQVLGVDFETVRESVANNMVTITMQRGDQFRAFVYIEKSVFDGKEETPAKRKEEVEAPSAPKSNLDNSFLSPIASMTSRLDVYDYVNQLQAEGKPVSFVNQPKGEETDKMYLVLYRRGGTIEAILTPVDAEGMRCNMATGEPDALDNHPNTSINGIKVEK